MRYNIKPHNFQRYNASFYDDTCIECNQPIEEGDPIGFLTDHRRCSLPPDAARREERYGPLCDQCLNALRTRAVITIEE